MRRIFATVLPLLVGLLTPLALVVPSASAACAPDGKSVIYRFKDRTTVFHPTNLASQWVHLPNGGSITYNQTKTKEVNAATTATVSAEAGAIFASASASFGLTIGGSYSKSDSWNYTANVPRDADHRYRLHQYHYSLTFKVMKKRWSTSTCAYTTNVWGTWQKVRHAPQRSERNSVWRLDKAKV
jgi:hypothetical protein